MLVILILFVVIGAISFAYRYVRWFVPGYNQPGMPLHAAQGVLIGVSTFINSVIFSLEVYVAIIFIIAVILGIVHDMSLKDEIRETLQQRLKTTKALPLSGLIDVTVGTVLVTRSGTTLMMIGNLVVLAICLGMNITSTDYVVRSSSGGFRYLL